MRIMDVLKSIEKMRVAEMIKLSNDHELEFVAASGSYGFDGRGYWWKFWEWPLKWTGAIDKSLLTIVIKTITLPPTKGNYLWYAPWQTVKLLSAEGKVIPWPIGLLRLNLVQSVANAFGLTNPGFWEWKEKHYPVIEPLGYRVIISITGREDECVFMAGEINQLKNVRGIEFNASCPNIGHGLLEPDEVAAVVEKLVQASRHPILLKLSYAQKYLEIAKATEGLVNAISFNAIPWHWIFPQRSPLEKFGGGAVSGQICRCFYERMLSDLLKAKVKTPVIMPVWSYEDIQWNIKLGASAHSFGSVIFPHPDRPTEYIRRWRKEKEVGQNARLQMSSV